jgi:hypothetical protein
MLVASFNSSHKAVRLVFLLTPSFFADCIPLSSVSFLFLQCSLDAPQAYEEDCFFLSAVHFSSSEGKGGRAHHSIYPVDETFETGAEVFAPCLLSLGTFELEK